MDKTRRAKELDRLEKIAKHFSMLEGVNGRLEKYRIFTVNQHLKGKTVLDVGCADGVMAKALSGKFRVTGIDGSKKLIERAQKSSPNVEFIHTLFEDYKPKRKFDNIVLSFILEHVEDPIKLLKLSKEWVTDNGRIIALVPNAWSLHRRVGKILDLLSDVHDLNQTDLKQGHRRVYDLDLLKKDIKQTGSTILETGGYFIKPLSEAQMVDWSDELLDAFYEVSKDFDPQYCMEIFAVFKK